ncbi:hypothetical protein ACKFKG_11870 [Phormidesmis sp. 146-35]
MFDPLRRLKFLPWTALLQVALVTVAIVAAFDVLIIQIFGAIPAALEVLTTVLSSPLILLIELAIAVGIGALSVAILERWFQRVPITNASLWALVPCLALWLLLLSFLPIPVALVPQISIFQIVGTVLGVFWKGRSYWR